MYNHLTVSKQMSSGLFKNNVTYQLFIYKSYKQDLALNKLLELICHKIQPTISFNCVQIKLSVLDRILETI